MKPEGFRLQAVAGLRRAERDACRAELAAALAEREQTARSREELQRALEKLASQRNEMLRAGNVTPATLLGHDQYEAALRRQLATRSAELESADAVVADCHERLLAAEQQHQVLVKLRERAEAELRAFAARREQSQLDELAVRRVAR